MLDRVEFTMKGTLSNIPNMFCFNLFFKYYPVSGQGLRFLFIYPDSVFSQTGRSITMLFTHPAKNKTRV